METMTGKDNKNPLSTVLARDAIRRVFEYRRALPPTARTSRPARTWPLPRTCGHRHLEQPLPPGHAVADSFSAAFHTPHGLNCIWGEAEVFCLVAPAAEEMHDIARCMGLDVADDAPVEQVADVVPTPSTTSCAPATWPRLPRAASRARTSWPARTTSWRTTRHALPARRDARAGRGAPGKIYDTYRLEA